MLKHGRRSLRTGGHREREKRSRRYPCTEKITMNELRDINTIATQLGIPDDWDIMIVGDGAGCWWDKPCSWGCTLIDRHRGRRKAFYGAMSCGTIMLAELMPAVHALLWFHEFHGRARVSQLGRPLNVHVVTDNQTTTHHWHLLNSDTQKAQKIRRTRPLWNVLLRVAQAGYEFHFHWVRRNTVELQMLADELAASAKKGLSSARLREKNGQPRNLEREIYATNATAS
jgi:hypothetical protein